MTPRFHPWPLLAILCFWAAGLQQLNLPGLHYDEAFEAVPAVQLLLNQPVQAFRNSSLSLFNREFPLMTQDYIGALNTYFSLPWLALGGISPFSLRVYALSVGAITLALVYGFTRSLGQSPRAGAAAVLLLCLNPTFVFWSRQGIFVTAINAGIGVAAAWAWLHWWRGHRFSMALLGSFLVGLGIYAKLLFLWFMAAGGLLALAAWWYQHHRQRAVALPPWRWFKGWQWPGLIAAFGLGCWPLLLYNFQSSGTWLSLTQNAATSYYGVDNTAFGQNLIVRLGQLGSLLSSDHLWYLGQVHRNPLLLPAFGLALLVSLILSYRGRVLSSIPFFVIGVVVLSSIVTVSDLWITHYALLMPWPAIALALVGCQILQSEILRQRWGHLLLSAVLLLLVIGEGLTTWQYHEALNRERGLSDHSDAVYDLSRWLHENSAPSVIAMDWGLAAPVTFLTAGRVTPIEVFGYEWEETTRFEALLQPHLNPDMGARFLWRTPEEIIFDRGPAFRALYQPRDLEENIVAAFYEENGRPLYGVTRLVPLGQAENKPLQDAP